MPLSATHRFRLTHVLLGLLTLGVWGLLLRSYSPLASAETRAPSARGSASFDTLTVQRINVVDSDGKTRLIIANSERFPGVEIGGKVYPRSIHDTAGLLFFDTKGLETGGLVLTKLGADDVANMTFDYTYQLTDGVRIIKQESADGQRWQAGFNVFDRRPGPGADHSSQGVQRIALIDENQNAQLVISDTAGHPRIRIGVDKTGKPLIETLNADGTVNYHAGE